MFKFTHWTWSRFFGLFGDGEASCLDYLSLSNAILQHKHSLEELSLLEDTNSNLVAFYGLGCLRSLREMSEVRYMDVELKAFRRPMDETQGQYTTSLADHLPANIEHLDLFIEGKGGDSWMEGLEDLARSCRLRLSALKRLEVYHVLGTVQYSETDQKRLMDAFEEEGIKLEFRFVRDDDELGLWTR